MLPIIVIIASALLTSQMQIRQYAISQVVAQRATPMLRELMHGFSKPQGIATDGTTLYIADYDNNRIRTIDIASKEVSTLAGSTAGYKDGVGTAAQFNNPTGIALSGTTLYIAEQYNNRIRAIDIASKEVSTLAGSTAGYKDGVGTAAQFNQPFRHSRKRKHTLHYRYG